jgi:nucleotide-binding universal stress UspA family protein
VFNHIVVACDGNPEGRDAVALGAAIASTTGARLSLVGVFSPWFLPIPGVTDRKTLRAQTTRTLRRERDLFAPDAFIHTIADGSVARALRHHAERSGADLVVMGSGPAASQGHVAIGRSGRQLLYDAPFSLALAARGRHQRAARLERVAVGYDGGPEAKAALALAAELAEAAHARLLVLVRRVVEDRVPALTPEEWTEVQDWSHEHIWEDARRTALSEAEAAAEQLKTPADVSATFGDPGYELRELSAAADLIVVGSRRWGPIARLVTGGVGETLVTDASSSVLIVARPEPRRRRARRPRSRRPALA